MENRKFKNYQKVAIANFLINGSRQDTWGLVEGFDRRSNLYLVNINGVIIRFPEDKLVDFGEFWDKKHKEQS